MLQNLVYVSKSTKLMKLSDNLELLTQARARNESLDITGLLLYKDMSYLQVLEGPKESVDQVFRSIELDPRHLRIKILARGPLEQRQFGDWSMGFRSHYEIPREFEHSYSSFMNENYDISGFVNNPNTAMDLLLHFRAYS